LILELFKKFQNRHERHSFHLIKCRFSLLEHYAAIS
jgi:hypothetical protein